ncbi:cation:proton antiporter, partial [Candidatus Peregrinibacteria bacterium]|nr:cation:proton antiporter [Candidatus Peregrinibacteria bacterium]
MENFQSLLILMVTVWVAGKLFRAIRLPVIFGELLGGVIVGPMVLGLIDPGSHTVELLAELGIFFLMFHSGLEADPHELAKASKKSLLIAAGGIILPFIGGYFIATAFGQTMVSA